VDQVGNPPAIVAAIVWIEHVLLGTAATMLATIAVAGVGMLLLTGRIEMRRGASVAFGCFLIFGAATIANGIIAAVQKSEAPAVANAAPAPPSYPQSPNPVQKGQNTSGYDPYAGAALPQK
jgi:type IV secretory pathway VirB2 component (pilin)